MKYYIGIHIEIFRNNLKLANCYIWSIALYGAENCTLRKVDQK